MNYCVVCKTDNIILQDDLYYVCINCGCVQDRQVYVCDKFEYQVDIVYNCTTYFKRLIKALQNKCRSNIPSYVYYLININNGLSPFEVLRKYRLFNFYILLPQIENTLYHKEPIKIDLEDERKLISLFCKVEKQIRKNYPNRKQILRYKSIIKRLMIHIGLNDIASLIPDLKTKKAKKEFNKIWMTLDI